MFQLLAPISLLALAGIALPVILHLRKVRKGKTLLVGSLSLFEEESPSRSKSWRWSEWLLLLLRCLLIGVLALLLARSVWINRQPPGAKGWLLVERKDLGQLYIQAHSLVDSLLGQGYRLHDFSPGFAEMAPKDTALPSGNPGASGMGTASSGEMPSYWTLLSLLQQETPSGVRLALLVPHTLNRFRGIRPLIEDRVHWYPYPTTDTSSPGRLPAVIPDTAGLSVTLYSDTYVPDLRYIQAALEALQGYTGRRIRVTRAMAGATPGPHQDWLFWLSAGAIPPDANADHIFRYEGGPEVGGSSPISFGDEASLVPEPVLLSRCFVGAPLPGNTPAGSNTPAARILWTTGTGKALLSQQSIHHQDIYHFYSRLDPAWNDLAWSPSLPVLLMDLLWGKDGVGATNLGVPGKDLRTIDDKQLLPDQADSLAMPPASVNAALPQTDLAHLCWVIAFILLVIERALALSAGRRDHVSAP